MAARTRLLPGGGAEVAPADMPAVLGALGDAAEARAERLAAQCADCNRLPPGGRCAAHHADAEAIALYRALADALGDDQTREGYLPVTVNPAPGTALSSRALAGLAAALADQAEGQLAAALRRAPGETSQAVAERLPYPLIAAINARAAIAAAYAGAARAAAVREAAAEIAAAIEGVAAEMDALRRPGT